MSRSPDFRYVYTNALGFGISDHDVKIIFSIMENPTEPENSAEQVGVNMTHKTAKLLHFLLGEGIAAVEKDHGEIPLDVDKIAAIMTRVGEATSEAEATEGAS